MALSAMMSYLLTVIELGTFLAATYLATTAIYNRYFHPLSKYPGPFWASISHLWYWHSVRYAVAPNFQRPLHTKYGQWVRIAPDTLSISDIAAQETIYGVRGTSIFAKAKFYEGFGAVPPIGGRIAAFSERDPVKHAERRRITAPLYTQSAILGYEPCVDRVVDLFVAKLDAFAASGEVFDLSIWLHKYAFDVIGEIYYGKEGGFGMIRDGIDYNNWVRCMATMPAIGASMTYMPDLLKPVWMLSEVLFGGREAREGLWGMYKVIQDAKAATSERVYQRASKEEAGSRSDMLNKLLDLVDEKGAQINWSSSDVATELWAVIWAGADTTASTLCSLMYHLHKNPSVLGRLRSELETAVNSGDLRLPIRYSEANKMPYLNAVLQEAMRIYSTVGLGLPRVVPPEGANICDKWIPGGMTVTMNANVVHFDKGVFGEDADIFRPERWLADEKNAAYMARHDMSFGMGSRGCEGKHITRTEMYKLVPTLLLKFDFEFDKPDREWKIYSGWFQQQSGVFMRVKRRE